MTIEKDEDPLGFDELRPGTEKWIRKWQEFFEENPGATREQVLNHLEIMKQIAGLRG